MIFLEVLIERILDHMIYQVYPYLSELIKALQEFDSLALGSFNNIKRKRLVTKENIKKIYWNNRTLRKRDDNAIIFIQLQESPNHVN